LTVRFHRGFSFSNPTRPNIMDKYLPMAIALGICYGVYKFVPGNHAKAGAIAVGAVIVAKQIPYLQNALA
jgi:hypothetical protein